MDFNLLVASIKDSPANYAVVAVLAGLLGLVAGWLLGRFAPTSCGCGSSHSHGGYTSSGNCVEIYVGNLSYDMTEPRLRKEFERYGNVKSARIITNRTSNKSKGFGFVEMPDRSEAEAAIKALHDADVLGRKLRVNEARNKTDREDD